jgi:hypothetical protein
MSTTTEIAAIREELSDLAERLGAVESQLGKNGSAPSLPFDVAAVMADIRQITQEIFPGRFGFTYEHDPEYPDDQYLVVEVDATGTASEVVERSHEWHDRIRHLSQELAQDLRLLIVPC